MHERFADWYRIATPGIDSALQPDMLERRWSGVEAAVKSLEDGEELEVVRLLLQMSPLDTGFDAKFRNYFKEADSTFALQGNDLELSVLAGVVVLAVIEGDDNLSADRSALALLCSNGVPRLAPRPWVSTFLEESRQYHRKRTRALRAAKELTPPSLKTAPANKEVEAFTQALPTGDWGGRVATTAKSAFAAILKLVEESSRSTAHAIEALTYQLSLRKEESDILWWMTAQYSRDLDRAISEVKAPAACLITGKELADMVGVPGPHAIESFLNRMLAAAGKAYEKPAALHAAVNATPAGWRTELSKRSGAEQVRDLCPVLGAIAASLSTAGEDEWFPAYSKSYGIEPKVQLPALDLAVQTYRECLLRQAVSE